MRSNSRQVRNFFNEHAFEYSKKYSKTNAFYRYFFYERLQKAIANLPLAGSRILDIGAGTGVLYNYLNEELQITNDEYFAIDIAADMLSLSNIPEKQRLVGNFCEMQIDKKFDLIFMLGVTTYMDKQTIINHFAKSKTLLAKNGMLVVTFTNKIALDIQLRGMLNPLLKRFVRKNTIFGQSFKTWYYNKSNISAMIEDWNLHSLYGLNHTFFPFSRLLPNVSIHFAHVIDRLNEGTFKHYLSSDLLYKLSPK